ncbi:E3 ubiquitin-protein ligase rnf8-B-like isoform X1 [Amphiura filiformis]|uniref:E3 ubiquitin-protein ligase rnf8-B-like isoform X1 n=2 Tax=Amphiura filiformis TaxID=82378 RepID=UPI003B20B7EB
MAEEIEDQLIWCLRQCGESPKYGLIPLPPGREVTLGRGLDVTVQLVSRKNPLMLSRKHAILKETDDGEYWTVRDNKSLNGIHVNGTQLSPQRPHLLQEGDIVQLAVAPDKTQPPDFLFTVVQEHHSPADVEVILKSYKKTRKMGTKGQAKGNYSQETQHLYNENTEVDTSGRDHSRSQRVLLLTNDQKRKLSDTSMDMITCSDDSERPSTSGSPLPKRQRQMSESEKELTEQLEKQKKEAEIQAKQAEEQLRDLMVKLKEQQEARMILEKQLKEKEKMILKELDTEKADFQSKRQQIQNEMEKAMECQVLQKELDLQEQLKLQQEAQAEERQRLENTLREEWERRLKEKEEDLTKLQQEMQATLESQVQEKEAMMMEQLRAQREELLWEKQRVEAQLQEEWSKKLEEKDKNLQELQKEMKTTLEKEIRDKEEMMLQQLESQRAALQNEKQRVEESLQEELERKLEEKNKDLQMKLEAEKAKLEEVIAHKEKEYSNLKNELNESKLEKEQQEEILQRARAEALQNITDVMETELTCSICSEFFMQATTLNCSHSFCNYCILTWMNKKRECPVCRTVVLSHNRSIVLDNYIDKMVEKLSEEMKDRRDAIIIERKKQQNENSRPPTSAIIFPRQQEPPIPIPVYHQQQQQQHQQQHHQQQQHHNRGYHHGHRGQPHQQMHHQNRRNDPIVISDGEGTDPIEVIDDNYDPGMPGYYYGGYGTCHRCGRRGHWSRGCPY